MPLCTDDNKDVLLPTRDDEPPCACCPLAFPLLFFPRNYNNTQRLTLLHAHWFALVLPAIMNEGLGFRV